MEFSPDFVKMEFYPEFVKMEVDSENEVAETHEDLDAPSDKITNQLPAKSRKSYEKVYQDFVKWCKKKGVNHRDYTEETFVVYFSELSNVYKASSLWTCYSKLRSTLLLHQNVDISKYTRILALLKRKSKGYTPKKSKILSREQILKFVAEAPDDNYLMTKVAVIMGVAGAMKCQELLTLSTDDIMDKDDVLIVNIRDAETRINRSFHIVNPEDNSLNFIKLYKKYASLRPRHTSHRRFFVFYKNGNCSTQPVGKNTLGRIPSTIAEYLKLPNPKLYTGHCLRRTSGSLPSNLGGHIFTFKRHGGRKTVLKDYTESPDEQEVQITQNENEDTTTSSVSENFCVFKQIKTEENMAEETGYLPEPKGFATAAIHNFQEPEKWDSMAVVTPMVASTTFKQYGPADFKKYEYGRSGNPNREVLENCLASLDNAKYGLCWSSGLGATTAVASLFKAGDHIICGDDVYGGTNRLFSKVCSNFGLEISFVHENDIEGAIKPNTKLIWVESLTNPTLKVIDIKAMAAIAQKHNILLAVDSTFLTPFFQRPINFGADLVIHSITKYINGHSDVIMGVIVTNNKELYDRLKFLQNAMGIVPAPFDCYQVTRSIKTLTLRMKQHMKNSLIVGKFLEQHPKVEKVLHPGLPTHPQHELFKKQTSGCSGMLSFYIKDAGLTESKKFLSSLKVFTLAESLGGYESLAELPSVMTHASVPEDQRKALKITDNLVRLSVGLEDVEDLISDLNQALAKI